MAQPYTLGMWTVKAGKEDDFVAAWKSFAAWTKAHQAGAGTAHLLRDSQNPRLFVSYGDWATLAAIKEWRERAEFQAFVAKVRGLLDDFQPHTMDFVAKL